MKRIAQYAIDNSQGPRPPRGCVRVFERLQSVVCAGLLAAGPFFFAMHSAEAQQATRRTNTTPATSGSSTFDLEQTEVHDPKLRALFQSNQVLNSVSSSASSGSLNRRAATNPKRAEQRTAWTKTTDSVPPSSALKKTPPPNAIQRASFDQTVEASTGSSAYDSTSPITTTSDSRTTSETSSVGSATDHSASVSPAESANTPLVEDRGEITPTETPAPAFLDLSEEGTAGKKRSGKAVGEHGAELSIETSPQHVLYRAVAWIVIALCMFSLAALGVRKWQRQRGLLPTSSGSSRVLETLSLGPGRAVSLIEMSGYRALVAFDAGGIKQLVLAPRSFDEELNLKEEPEEVMEAS